MGGGFWLHRKIFDFPHLVEKGSDENRRSSYIVTETKYTSSATDDSWALCFITAMEIDNKEIKPVSDILGLAVMDSQRLEYQLAFMMLLVNNEFDLKDSDFDKRIDDYMLGLSKQTLGRLITKLKEHVEVNEELQRRLEEALDARNFLIHRLLNQAGEKFLTIEGRKELLQLVKAKRKILYECYMVIDPFVHLIAKIKGLSLDQFTNELSNEYEPDEQ